MPSSYSETSPILGPRHHRRTSHSHSHSASASAPSIASSFTTLTAQAETRTLLTACAVTAVFFVVELVGGYFAHSLAIMSDAAHLLSDVAGFAISLIAVVVSGLPPNSRMSYGFARAETLGAFVSIFFIWALTAVLVIFAVYRLFHPTPVDGPLMLFLGLIGLGVNLILGFVLGHGHSHAHSHSHAHAHAHAHSHSHSHSHSHDIESTGDCDHHDHTDHEQPSESSNPLSRLQHLLFANDISSVNLRAAYLHVLGDAIQSVGVIIAALFIMYNPALSVLDPLCTILFAVLVVFTTSGLASDTIAVLMEATPPTIQLDDIHTRLTTIEGVDRVGDLHAWSISSNRPAMSVHLFQKPQTSAHDVLKQAQRLLAEEFGIHHSTVQINCQVSDCCDNDLHPGTCQKPCVTYDLKSPSTIQDVSNILCS